MALNIETERDIERLRSVARVQDAELKRILAVLLKQQRELAELRGEEFNEQQHLELLVEPAARRVAEVAEPPPEKPRKKRTKFGNKAQPALLREVLKLDLDEPDRACPACGGQLDEVSGQYETSEMVDVVDVTYKLVEVRQKKYRCRCGGCIETALPAERSIKGGRYSLDFGVKVAIDKYLHHIPLARQVRMMLGHGLVVARNTLWDQLDGLARDLAPVAAALLDDILARPVIGLDQTSWPSLEAKKKKRRNWQMWCFTAPGAVAHRIRGSKSLLEFEALVGDFNGIIVCDAASTHIAGAKASPDIELAGCWAHVRRKFAEAEPNFPRARIALMHIRKLYDIEEQATSEEHRARLRNTESRGVLDRLKAWLIASRTLTSTDLGSAIAYTLSKWDMFERFLGDPAIPLDNNATERGLRGPVVGRRNHFGSKSERGTEVAAILYSLLESAKLSGVDAAEYLRAAVVAARRGEVLLPGQFAET